MNCAILLMQKYRFSCRGQDEDMGKLHHHALFPVIFLKIPTLAHYITITLTKAFSGQPSVPKQLKKAQPTISITEFSVMLC